MKEFEVSFREKLPRIMSGACGYKMENPLGDFSIVSVADKACFVIEKEVPSTFLTILHRLFPNTKERHFFLMPTSEKAKTLREVEKLCAFLYEKGFSRNSVIVACGGGAITDAAGFASSIYMRGIRWVSVPTTFLGQIDAGLGGKTGINLDCSKNIIGSFWQPAALVLEADFLSSLSYDILLSGAGELVKYALLLPPNGGKILIEALPKVLAGDVHAMQECIYLCAEFKLKLVGSDERDQFALREKLNLGHTAGHAFEALSEETMPHGEAVAHGLKFSIILSNNLDVLSDDDSKKMLNILDSLNLPRRKNWKGNFKQFLALVAHDKKAGSAKNRFVLPVSFGFTEAIENVDLEELNKAYEETIK